MTYYPAPAERVVKLPAMTADEADRLLDLLEAITVAIRARAAPWHDPLDLPLDAALEVAYPPSAEQLEADQAELDRVDSITDA